MAGGKKAPEPEPVPAEPEPTGSRWKKQKPPEPPPEPEPPQPTGSREKNRKSPNHRLNLSHRNPQDRGGKNPPEPPPALPIAKHQKKQKTRNCGLYKATFYSNIGSFLFGIAVGWTAATEKSVMDRSFYKFHTSPGEWSAVCNMLTLGAALWCIPVGLMARSCGCKRTILIQAVPNTLGWFIIVFAQSVTMLYLGRFILGMCGGAHSVVVPIYLAEISTAKKRGAMVVLYQGACICGVFYSFAMSVFVEMWIFHVVTLALLPLLFLQILMPETPGYYVDRGKIGEAEETLRWLRGKKYNPRREIDHLAGHETYSEQDARQGPLRGFKFKKIRRSLARCLALAVFQKLCGALIFIFFGQQLMNCLRIHHIYLSVVCLAVALGCLACFLLVDRLGRRPLLILSTVVIFFVSAFLGLYFKIWMSSDFPVLSWTALVCIALFMGAHMVGLGTLFWVLNVELIVRYMRPVGCSLILTCNWLTAVFVLCWYSGHEMKCQPYLFMLFAIIALMSLLFCMVYIPETKLLSSEKIQERLGGIMNRPTAVTFTSSSDTSL
ncbi:glucose transporter type 3 [Drosophila ficusphila]|uniref:glucose transporter type 3 n=1 Tax=Drosophila ficusphila TaxID=30025 RepID=UPI001C89AC9E|nr:glucose transporter type 3 [Drosophila ficusphila]